MLIFERFAGKKPTVIVKYELFTAALQILNLDNKNKSFLEHLLPTALVYQRVE